MVSEKDEYADLLSRWNSGERGREIGLRLLFLAWYCLAEPAFLTGLPDDGSSLEVVREVFDWLGGEETEDPELQAVVAVMARVAADALGDADEWTRVGRAFEVRAPALDTFDFSGRGAYGEYFAHQAGAARRWRDLNDPS